MSQQGHSASHHDINDLAPGDEHHGESGVGEGIRGYLIGFVLASGLTIASFGLIGSHLLWGPSVPAALLVLAIAQMGVHLAFFLHITTGPDNTNNVMALAFGILIVFLVVIGSIWIMAHMNHNMMPQGMGSMMGGAPMDKTAAPLPMSMPGAR